jgi:hypothetical protein
MLDSFSKKSGNTLLVDQETFGIIAYGPSIPVMQALSEGIQNSSVMTVVFHHSLDKFRGTGLDAPTTENYILLRRTGTQAVTPSDCNVARGANIEQMFGYVDMEAPTAEWIEKRTLAKNRQIGLWLLEQKIERYLSRAKMFTGDDVLLPFLASELQKCDFTKQVYSDVVVEWASIAGINVNEAYHILSNKVMSINIIVSRLHAMWFKYVNKINALSTSEEIMRLVNFDLETELRSGTT